MKKLWLVIVALVVLLLSGSCTTFLIGNWTEQVFLTHDSAIRNVLYLALFTAGLYFLRKTGKVEAFLRRVDEDKGLYQNGQLFLILVLLIEM